DFYFRFFPFFVSALHERRGDILYYIHYFDGQVLKHFNRETVLTILSYNWPGNVREIKLFIRLFKINKILFSDHLSFSNIISNLPDDVFSEDDKISFIEAKQHFQIDPNYSKFNIVKHLMFLKKLFENCNSNHFTSILKVEELFDYCIGFSETDSPFPFSEPSELIEKPIFDTDPNKEMNGKIDRYYFNFVKNQDIEKVLIAYNAFCILFFRDHKANNDLLDFDNFMVPEIDIDCKTLKKNFSNFDAEKLSVISLEILSLFSKIQKFSYGRKKLPMEYIERKEAIKKIYEKHSDSNFLSDLLGIQKTDHSISDFEIDIKELTEMDILKSYYGTLYYKTGGRQIEMSDICGKSPASVSIKIKEYNIQNESTHILKAYKRG
ncbi:MAG: hypothetical protein HQK65_21435, partial [Desulfamplus sp.]|nr:hypothetical protein [Desulfamplus sp.]